MFCPKCYSETELRWILTPFNTTAQSYKRLYRQTLLKIQEECIDVLSSIYTKEKITASITLEIEKFYDLCKSWGQYLKRHKPDLV